MTCAAAGDRSRGLLALLLVGFGALVLAGCTSAGGTSAGGGASATTTPVATPTSESAQTSTTVALPPATVLADKEDVEAAVVEAFHSYNAAFRAASSPFDPDYPGLDEFSAGGTRERITKLFTELRDSGATVFGNGSEHEVLAVQLISPTEAIVETCSLDAVGVRSADGLVLIEPDVEPLLNSKQLEKIEGTWKLVGASFTDGTEQVCALKGGQ